MYKAAVYSIVLYKINIQCLCFSFAWNSFFLLPFYRIFAMFFSYVLPLLVQSLEGSWKKVKIFYTSPSNNTSGILQNSEK